MRARTHVRHAGAPHHGLTEAAIGEKAAESHEMAAKEAKVRARAKEVAMLAIEATQDEAPERQRRQRRQRQPKWREGRRKMGHGCTELVG